MSARDELVYPESADAHLDVVDVRIPCRRFAIKYKVAEVGKVSLTSEFLLRLVHSVEGVAETDAASFFGFTHHEMSYVINDLVNLGYLDRRDGGLWLSIAGRELFPPHSDIPEIYDVEQRSEEHVFDVIALAPVRARSLTPFELALPEVPVAPSKVSDLSKLMEASFKKHFNEVGQRGSDANVRQSLYSVDDVVSVSRLSTTATVTIVGKRNIPGAVEPDLSKEWSPYQLDDRVEIVEATARLIGSWYVKASERDDGLFEALATVAPDMMAEFQRSGSIRRTTLYREAARRAGYLRSNQRTVLILGSLFTDANFERVLRALRYSSKDASVPDEEVGGSDDEDISQDGALEETESSSEAPKTELVIPFFWHVPHLPIWGATKRLPRALEILSNRVTAGGHQANAVCVSLTPPSFLLQRAFNHIISSNARPKELTRLEIFLVPGKVAAVIAHAPVDEESYPVPLGILSFDEAVITSTTHMLQDLIFEPITVLQSSAPADIEGAVRRALWR